MAALFGTAVSYSSVALHASQGMYSKVLSDAMLEQLEQLESVPDFDSSDSGSESVCGKLSCEMECQVSSLGIDDEQCGKCPEQKACEDARCRLDLR